MRHDRSFGPIISGANPYPSRGRLRMWTRVHAAYRRVRARRLIVNRLMGHGSKSGYRFSEKAMSHKKRLGRRRACDAQATMRGEGVASRRAAAVRNEKARDRGFPARA
jgi:hypothetical protein